MADASAPPPQPASAAPALVPVPTGERPTNNLVTALLTDMYQITMAYAYWRAGR